MVKLQFDGKQRVHITVLSLLVRFKQWNKGQHLVFVVCVDSDIKIKELP